MPVRRSHVCTCAKLGQYIISGPLRLGLQFTELLHGLSCASQLQGIYNGAVAVGNSVCYIRRQHATGVRCLRAAGCSTCTRWNARVDCVPRAGGPRKHREHSLSRTRAPKHATRLARCPPLTLTHPVAVPEEDLKVWRRVNGQAGGAAKMSSKVNNLDFPGERNAPIRFWPDVPEKGACLPADAAMHRQVRGGISSSTSTSTSIRLPAVPQCTQVELPVYLFLGNYADNTF